MVNINGGLDPRDSHLDIAFILGDDDIPDDVSWLENLRDKSCVWLDFEDLQFNPCVYDDTRKEENHNLPISGDSDDILAEKYIIQPFEVDNSNHLISSVEKIKSTEIVSDILPIVNAPVPTEKITNTNPKDNIIYKNSAPNKTISASGKNKNTGANKKKDSASVKTTVRRVRGCN
jgi:hypothetical protein